MVDSDSVIPPGSGQARALRISCKEAFCDPDVVGWRASITPITHPMPDTRARRPPEDFQSWVNVQAAPTDLLSDFIQLVRGAALLYFSAF